MTSHEAHRPHESGENNQPALAGSLLFVFAPHQMVATIEPDASLRRGRPNQPRPRSFRRLHRRQLERLK